MGRVMKREWWIILLAFLGGIALTNLLGSELLTAYGILNEYFLRQYSYQTIDENRLFCHVAGERMQAAFFFYILGRAMDGRIFALLVKGLAAAMFGFLSVAAIVNLGARGIVVVLCGLFPQWLCYLAALFLYANWRSRQGENRRYDTGADGLGAAVTLGGILAVCILAGILAESWINPMLLAWVQKIF